MWPVYEFYADYCSTQWRVGMNGPTGLDHASVIADIGMLGLPPEEAKALYADVRALERYALEEMREMNKG